MANIAQMVNVLQAMRLTDHSKMVLTPTYHGFEMHIPFQDSTAIPIEIGATPRVQSQDRSIPSIFSQRLCAGTSRFRQGRQVNKTVYLSYPQAPVDPLGPGQAACVEGVILLLAAAYGCWVGDALCRARCGPGACCSGFSKYEQGMRLVVACNSALQGFALQALSAHQLQIGTLIAEQFDGKY
jgi:hypothetical protein